jgi:hypothetical protein
VRPARDRRCSPRVARLAQHVRQFIENADLTASVPADVNGLLRIDELDRPAVAISERVESVIGRLVGELDPVTGLERDGVAAV